MAFFKSKPKEYLRLKIIDLFDNFYKPLDRNGIKIKVVITEYKKSNYTQEKSSSELLIDFNANFDTKISQTKYKLIQIVFENSFNIEESRQYQIQLEKVYLEVIKIQSNSLRKRIPLTPDGYFDIDIVYLNDENPIANNTISLSSADLHISRKERKAIRQTKIFKHNAHEFKIHFFSTPTFCAYCTDFLWGLTNQGVECRNCNLVAHERCFKQFKGICSRNKDEVISTEDIGSLPHVFKRKQFWRPTFCDHDGTLIKGLIDQGLQCKKCHINIHPNCRNKVMNICGLINEKDSEEEKLEKIRKTQTKIVNKLMTKKLIKEAKIFSEFVNGDSFDDKPQEITINTCDKKIGDFQLEAFLGKGGFGKVFLVREIVQPNKPLAMKVFKKHKILIENDLDYTRSEYEIMTKTGPCVFLTSLHYAFHSNAFLFFVMDYIAAGDLYSHILESQRKRSTFSIERIRFYAAQILLALKYLHSLEIVYRDIKPENILVCSTGYIKLTDFGMCKQGVDYAEKKTRTWCGTPEYMVPEMLLGKEYNCTCDFWSYGILLTEMSTCQTPFYNSIEEKLHENIINKPPVLSAVHDQDLKDLITKLLEKDPNIRLGNPKLSNGKIQDHPFFKSKISWKELNEQKMKPPFVPELDNETDLRYFYLSSKRPSSLQFSSLSREDKALLKTIDDSCFSCFSYSKEIAF